MTVQRVVVTRSGGFAGLRVTTEVDDPEEAERLTEAVRSAAGRPSRPVRDGFVYEFTIVTTTETHRIELTAAQLPPEVSSALRDRRS